MAFAVDPSSLGPLESKLHVTAHIPSCDGEMRPMASIIKKVRCLQTGLFCEFIQALILNLFKLLFQNSEKIRA